MQPTPPGLQPSGEPQVWVVIPVYNHAATATAVVRACRRRVERVLVVDDGSEDADLRELLREDPVTVIRHARNQGKGQALVTALQHVAAQGGTHMITVDADGQHLAEDLPAFLEAIRAEPRAIVIGCRDFDRTANVPSKSRFGRQWSNFWVRLETGRALTDTQSGYRAYPVGLAGRLPRRSSRYDFETELLVRALWAGLPVREVPIQVVYPPGGERISHYRPVRDTLRMSRLHARLAARCLLPWPHQRLVPRERPPWALWRHPLRELRRLLDENATPAGLAASAAVGSLLAVLPLVWCHTLAILYATARLHLNKVMALTIQTLYIPPFTPFLCIQVGHYLRHGRWWTEFTRQTVVWDLHLRLFEWLLGSLLLAPLYALIAGAATYAVAAAVRRRREGA